MPSLKREENSERRDRIMKERKDLKIGLIVATERPMSAGEEEEDVMRLTLLSGFIIDSLDPLKQIWLKI